MLSDLSCFEAPQHLQPFLRAGGATGFQLLLQTLCTWGDHPKCSWRVMTDALKTVSLLYGTSCKISISQFQEFFTINAEILT